MASAVAVVPARYAPEANFTSYARGYAEGVAKGAGTGTLVGIGLLLQLFAAAGPAAIVVAPVAGAVFAGAAVVGLASGAAVGAARATPEEQAAAIERLATSVATEFRLPDATARVIEQYTRRFTGYGAEIVEGIGPASATDEPDYRSLGARGFGSAIEVHVSTIGFVAGEGGDPDLMLFVAVSARLVDSSTGMPNRLRGLVYLSPPHKMAVWVGEDAAMARIEIRRALDTLGSRVVDGFFLQTESAVGFDVPPLPASCGNMPVQPKAEWTTALFAFTRPVTATVDSITPWFAWETLPARVGQSPATPWDNAHDLLYDLRIWSEVDGGPGELIYERYGLAQPRHQVEVPLASGARYFWSVRMRYTVDGHPRASRWSASNEPLLKTMPVILDRMFYSRVEGDHAVRRRCYESDLHPCGCLDFIPVQNFYTFRTPAR